MIRTSWIPLALVLAFLPSLAATAQRYPSVMVVTVDTLRADRLGGYGYYRDTSPNLDRLMADGVRFEQARCVEPLTAPSMASMLTSLHPHDHGASRNGLRVRPDVPSLPRILEERGFGTAAFVSNWTLKDELLGMGGHFDEFQEVFTRKRYFGLMNAEADGNDVTAAALKWLEGYAQRYKSRPFFAWVHYSDPHAPYQFHEEFKKRLQLEGGRKNEASDHYDTEVAFVDRAVGHLLQKVEKLFPEERVLLVFAADHGENLGEHGYWGHGRHLWEEGLKIPMAVTWPGRIVPGTVATPATILDVAPTVLGLLGLPTLGSLQGFDWSAVLLGKASPPTTRTTYHQAHRGAVRSPKNTEKIRRRGLLSVGLVTGEGDTLTKEVLRVRSDRQSTLYDLPSDPQEMQGRNTRKGEVGISLTEWLEQVRKGLEAADDLPPPSLDKESMDKLRALGYLD